jgi:hypothetical protein
MHQLLFNLIHNENVIKVDCIVRKQNDYRINEFNRRQRIKIRDFETWIVSKEDLILSKLFWAKDSRSETQLRDVKTSSPPAATKPTSNVGQSNLVWLTCGRKSRMSDTSPEIAELVRQKLMARSAEERCILGVRMFDAARAMVLASLPADLPPEQLKRQLFQRIYGQPLPF